MNRIRKQLRMDDCQMRKWNGTGISVAVLDSGIVSHPDFGERIIHFQDFISGRQKAYDDYGHGTHVCGILGGSGIASNGLYRGVADGCLLQVYKILDQNGEGKTEHLLAAVNSILVSKDRLHTRIVNISIGVDSSAADKQSVKNHAMIEDAIRLLVQNDMIVVTAAGNNGPKQHSISVIGSYRQVLSVGCHDGNYIPKNGILCASYSGRGGTEDQIRKPDIVAPGTEIISCNHRYYQFRNRCYHAYCQKSGTSMATPIVSGCIAAYLQKYPNESPKAVLQKLKNSALDLNEPHNMQGYGMINPYAFLGES